MTRKKMAAFILVTILMLGFQYSLNFLSPLVADDYDYCFNSAGQRTGSVGEIIETQIVHYNMTNGRSIAHFFAQLFLFLGKPLFNAVNALLYCLFALLVYAHINGRAKPNIYLYLCVHVALWFLLPVYGSTVLFLTGACNYLWMTALILAFLLPYRLYLETPFRAREIFTAPAMLVFGVAAGWSNETAAGCALLFAALGAILLLKRKGKLPLWWIAGLLGCAVGLLVMIKAPGNAIRLDGTTETWSGASLAGHVISLALVYTAEYLKRFLALLGVFLVLLLFGEFRGIRRETLCVSLLYLLLSLAGNYVMLLSLVYPPRAQFTYTVFLILAFGHFMINSGYVLRVAPARYALTLAAALLFSTSACMQLNDLGAVYTQWREREQFILAQKNAGISDVTVSAIDSRTLYASLVTGDIKADPADWINRGVSRYYGIRSIRTAD